MYEIKSTITSKGQLTLPKPIRNAMELEAGDEVSFSYNKSKDEATLKKLVKYSNDDSVFQLFNYFINNYGTVSINGISGAGKTRLAERYIYTLLEEKSHIYMVNFFKEDANAVTESIYGENIKSVSPIGTNDTDKLMEINLNEADYIFVDNADKVETEFLENVLSSNTKAVFIYSNEKEDILQSSKGYLKVNVLRDVVDLELVKNKDGVIESTPIINLII